jgi:hypothetical protein
MEIPYIYLDWNCFKYIKNNPDSNFHETIKILKETSSYLFPYSFAHLADLQKNLSKETFHYIKSDLELIETVTSSYMIGMFEDDYKISIQKVGQMFNQVLHYNQGPIEHSDQEINLADVDSSNFEDTIIKGFDRFNADPNPYKAIRSMIVNSTAPSEEFSFFDDLSKNVLTEEVLKDAVNKQLQLDDTYQQTLSIKVLHAFMLLEFNSEYQEKQSKITKKNNFSNIYTDGEHLKFALNSKIYITEDKALRKKAKLVYKTYGIQAKVMSIEEFVKEFLPFGV